MLQQSSTLPNILCWSRSAAKSPDSVLNKLLIETCEDLHGRTGIGDSQVALWHAMTLWISVLGTWESICKKNNEWTIWCLGKPSQSDAWSQDRAWGQPSSLSLVVMFQGTGNQSTSSSNSKPRSSIEGRATGPRHATTLFKLPLRPTMDAQSINQKTQGQALAFVSKAPSNANASKKKMWTNSLSRHVEREILRMYAAPSPP